MVTFTLQDTDLIKESAPLNGLKVRDFKHAERQLVQVKAAKDVVLLRHVKVGSIISTN